MVQDLLNINTKKPESSLANSSKLLDAGYLELPTIEKQR